MVLTVGKWMHEGSGRGSEWLLTDSDTKRCYFIRRTKTGKLACGAQGNFESADDWLKLTEFACASDSHIKRRTLTFRQISGSDQWVEQGSATRRILWVGWIDLHLMRVFWSPTVHNFSRWQFQLVQGQFVAEVLQWLDPDHWNHSGPNRFVPSDSFRGPWDGIDTGVSEDVGTHEFHNDWLVDDLPL